MVERLGGLAGGRRQRGGSAFEGRDALLEDVGGRVHDARVDVAELLQREEAAGMVGVLKQVRRGLVDGNGARAGGGIGRLTGMDGEGGEVLLLLFGHPVLLRIVLRLSAAGRARTHQAGNAKARILFRIRAAWFLIGCA